jgi:hypothetical protein
VTLAETFPVYKLRLGRLQGPPACLSTSRQSSHLSLLSLSCLCESSSSNSVRTSAHIRTRMLLGLLLMSMLRLYSELHSSSVIRPPLSTSSNSIQTSAHVRAQRLLRPLLTSVLGHYSDSCAQMLLGLLLTSVLGLFSELHSDVCVSLHLTSLSPRLRTPFRPLSLSVLRSEPLPSNSTRRSAQASAWTSVSRSVLRV